MAPPASVSAGQLLAKQHEYVSATLGFLIHPTIDRAFMNTERSKVRIADVSQCLHLDTADIAWTSREQIAFQEILSEQGPTSRHLESFDVVAVRLLHLSVPADAWDLALRNLISLLRPGGWIQWADWDPATARVAGATPGTSDQALRKLLQSYHDVLKESKVGKTYKISGSLRSSGLDQDDADIYPLTPDVPFTSNIAENAVIQLRSANVLSTGGLEKLESEVNREIRDGGPLLWFDLWCHIAHKPNQG